MDIELRGLPVFLSRSDGLELPQWHGGPAFLTNCPHHQGDDVDTEYPSAVRSPLSPCSAGQICRLIINCIIFCLNCTLVKSVGGGITAEKSFYRIISQLAAEGAELQTTQGRFHVLRIWLHEQRNAETESWYLVPEYELRWGSCEIMMM